MERTSMIFDKKWYRLFFIQIRKDVTIQIIQGIDLFAKKSNKLEKKDVKRIINRAKKYSK